ESKIRELTAANEFNQKIKELAGLVNDNEDQAIKLRAKTAEAHRKLDEYRVYLTDTVNHHRDADGGKNEAGWLDVLETDFQAVEDVVGSLTGAEPNSGKIQGEEKLRSAISKLQTHSDDLREAIQKDIFDRKDVAKGHDRLSMIVVCSTSVFGVILL